MKRQYEEKLLATISRDIKEISNSEISITEKYYNTWVYLNEIINTVSGNASDWLLTELYIQKQYYHLNYLINKGLK